jgi:hypothetical protein
MKRRVAIAVQALAGVGRVDPDIATGTSSNHNMTEASSWDSIRGA